MVTLNDKNLLEETIIQLLLERGPEKSICSSEVVRMLNPNDWRYKMKDVRSAVRSLVLKNIIVIT